MALSHAQLDEHDAEIREIFRGWLFWDKKITTANYPEWLSSEEYELIHKCIREVYTLFSANQIMEAKNAATDRSS